MRAPVRIPILFCLLLAFTVPASSQVPIDFPEVTVTELDDPAPGYIFLSNFSFSQQTGNVPYLMMLDNSGYPVHYQELDMPINMDFELHPDETLTYHNTLSYQVLDDNLDVVDIYAAGNGYHTDGHELRMLPNGHAYLLGWTIRRVDMTPYGGFPNAQLQDMVIQEVDRNGTVYWEWNTVDHFDVTDATRDIDLTRFYVDWVHCNAIEIDTDGNILLSSRHLDEITKIDRSTGDIMWRLGGKECRNNQFTFIDDYVVEGQDTLFYGFSHQHAIRRLENGNILLFDNGNLREPSYSRAVEYALDEVNLTATKVWEYRNTPDVVSTEMGYTQRLPNGNTLIGWGGGESGKAVTEVRPDGSKAFEMSFPEDIVSYRAFRFVYDMEAVTRSISGPGTYDFNELGNETGVSLDVDAIVGSGDMTAQHHYYGAHNQVFPVGDEPDSTYPARWVVTQSGLSGIDASIRFDLALFPEIDLSQGLTVFRRPCEGEGEFEFVPAIYNADLQELEADMIGTGEWIIGSVGSLGGIGETPPPLPRGFQLEQNFPNPFNGSTVIHYNIPEAGRVKLAVFDLQGRKVATLVDGKKRRGSYQASFAMGDNASGVYIYRLQWEVNKINRKMIILR